MAVISWRLLLLASGFASLSLGTPSSPSSDAQPSFDALDLSSGFGIPQPFVNKTRALFRYRDPPHELLKRDCFANGTNYCFGNTVNYCATCGTCCSDSSSKWCCPSDATCCGSSCCGSGQTCTDGKCFLAEVTVTVGNTVVATVTETASKVDTVIETVIETSTINSVVEVTVTSTGATQTDWTYVTVTADAPAKRSLAPSPSRGIPPGVTQQAALLRRQEATKAVEGEAPTTTVSDDVTQTSVVTDVITTAITTSTTSTFLTTLLETHTNIVGAAATVQSTSTLTYTSRPPTTVTSTQIATAITSPTGKSSPSPVPVTSPAPSGLSTPAIAGIAVGSAVFAILAATLIFAWVRYRRHQERKAQQYEATYLGLGGPDQHTPYDQPGYEHMRQPTLPIMAASTTPPQHHRYSAVRPGHTRTSSGYTSSTAVASHMGGGQPKPNRVSAVSYGSYGGYNHAGVAELHEDGGPAAAVTPSVAELYEDEAAVGPAEVAAHDVHRYEMEDSNGPSPAPGYENVSWPPPGIQPPELGDTRPSHYRDF